MLEPIFGIVEKKQVEHCNTTLNVCVRLF